MISQWQTRKRQRRMLLNTMFSLLFPPWRNLVIIVRWNPHLWTHPTPFHHHQTTHPPPKSRKTKQNSRFTFYPWTLPRPLARLIINVDFTSSTSLHPPLTTCQPLCHYWVELVALLWRKLVCSLTSPMNTIKLTMTEYKAWLRRVDWLKESAQTSIATTTSSNIIPPPTLITTE